MHKNNSVLRSCKCQLGDKLNYYVSLEEVFSPSSSISGQRHDCRHIDSGDSMTLAAVSKDASTLRNARRVKANHRDTETVVSLSSGGCSGVGCVLAAALSHS